MLDNRGVDLDPGWINRRLHDLARDMESLRSERRAAATMISAGDFTVSGGGSVRVLDGGGVTVTGGGDIVIRDGGEFHVLHSNGQMALYMGPYLVGATTNVGLLIRDPSGLPILSGEYDTVTGERRVRLGNITPAGARLASLMTAAADSVFYGPNDSVYLYMDPAGDISIRPDLAAGKSVIIGHNTTANAANTYMDTVGRVYRSTSSRRYKQDERPADIDVSKVLALEPRVFRSRDEVEDEGDAAPTHVGFIAEEAADLGLDLWVSRDEAGDPESFAYPLWGVAQQAVIQAQQAQIDALTAQVAALSEQVAALTPTPTTTTKRTL